MRQGRWLNTIIWILGLWLLERLSCNTTVIDYPISLSNTSQILLSLLHTRQYPAQRTHRRREEVLAASRDHERRYCVQLDCFLCILWEQAGNVYLFALAQLAQDGVEADSRPDEVPLIGPLALDEGEAIADGALVADEEEAASAVGVGVEFVALIMSAVRVV
jgi:hypothetical protein